MRSHNMAYKGWLRIMSLTKHGNKNHLQTSLQNFFCLGTPHSAMNGDLLITADTKWPNSVSCFGKDRLLTSKGFQYLKTQISFIYNQWLHVCLQYCNSIFCSCPFASHPRNKVWYRLGKVYSCILWLSNSSGYESGITWYRFMCNYLSTT